MTQIEYLICVLCFFTIVSCVTSCIMMELKDYNIICCMMFVSFLLCFYSACQAINIRSDLILYDNVKKYLQ